MHVNAKDLSRDVQAGAAREDWCGVRRKFHINASVGGKGRKVPAAKRKRTSPPSASAAHEAKIVTPTESTLDTNLSSLGLPQVILECLDNP